jgi:RNA polymerase sigma factor (sigma-70 family)
MAAQTWTEPLAPSSSAPGPLGPVRDDAGARGSLEVLARRAAASDRGAAEALARALGPVLLGVLRALVGRANPEIEDMLQESMLAVTQSIDRFRGECTVRQYASKIAVRVVLASRKRARALRRSGEMVELSDDLAGGSLPTVELAAKRRRVAFRSLLDDLPDAQAEALVLRNVLGYSIEEIAGAAQVPVNTVRSRLRLAKEAVRARVAGDPALAEALEVEP